MVSTPTKAPTEPLFLAIDQGGQGTRVAAYNVRGETLSQARSRCQTLHPRPDFVEQNAEDILSGLYNCLSLVTEDLGPGCRQLKAAGLACQGSTLVCWDRVSGDALSPVISWQDCRAKHQLESLVRQSPTSLSIENHTGLRWSPHYGASKMHWCLEHLPMVQTAARRDRLVMGPLASYLLQHLTQHPHPQVDCGHAQRTLLWSIQTQQWSPALCRLFSINPRWLPRCHNNIHAFGDLQRGKLRVPVTVCLRDQAASLFGRGEPNAHSAYINLGTGAFLQRLTQLKPAPQGQLLSPLLFSGTRKTYTWEAGVNGAAAAIPWLEQRLSTTLSPARINAAVDHCWRSLNTVSRYFINSCAGLAAPYWRTDIPPRFSPELDTDSAITAWIESLIFLLHTNLQLMRNDEPAITRIDISGGLSQCDPLCQGLADITALPVHRAGDSDSTLRGVGYLAAERPASWQTQPEFIDESRLEKYFTPENNPALEKTFQDWKNAMEQSL